MRVTFDPPPEFYRERLAAIRQRNSELIARTLAQAEAFAASPAYARAMGEIVEKGCKLGLTELPPGT